MYSNKMVVNSRLDQGCFATYRDAKVISSENKSLRESFSMTQWGGMILLWLSSDISCSQVICFSEILDVPFYK
jgi:hypothetical protein